jgi:hypothetical protein
MSKISVRSVPAALFAGLVLAACGGGGDDGTAVDNQTTPAADSQTIPAGAAECKLHDYQPSSHGIIDWQNTIRSDSDGFSLSINLVDGGTRYAISNSQSFYALVSTWSDHDPYGVVEAALTVPTNKRTVLYYSNYLGTLNGRHVEGESREWIVIGGDNGQEYVTPEEVQGISLPAHGGAWPASPHMMSAPRLTQLDRHLFRVQEGRYQEADWSRLSNATVEFEVLTDSETGSNSGYRHCEIRGLTGSVNTIAVTGGLPGEAYWVMVRTYAPLDGGIQAYSKTEFVRFEY